MNVRSLRLGVLIAACIAIALVVMAFVPLNVGITHVRTEVDVARAPRDVYEYVTTPANWPRWHPSSVAVTGDAAHSLAVGESVVEEFKVAGQHGFATWRVVAREPDRLWRIEGAIDGHLAGVVTYTLSGTGSHTHFVRLFDYPSRTLLFAVVNAFVLHKRITAESEQALTQLREVLESKDQAAWSARPSRLARPGSDLAHDRLFYGL